MVGTQALIAFHNPNGEMKVDTFKINSYQEVIPSDIDFAVSNKEAEFDGMMMRIFATLTLPKGMTTVNEVWQVGSAMNGDSIPAKHAMARANVQSMGLLNLVGGPGDGGQLPGEGGQGPSGGGQQGPGDGGQSPGNGRQGPGDGRQGPSDGGQVPGDGGQVPGGGGQEPGNGGQGPGDGGQVPGNGGQVPGGGGQRPGDGGQGPGNGGQFPGDGGQGPGFGGGQVPGNGGQVPGCGGDGPGGGGGPGYGGEIPPDRLPPPSPTTSDSGSNIPSLASSLSASYFMFLFGTVVLTLLRSRI
ncbi:uncharacterized protein LOC143846757 [Tasmannia lanceolata]|uniref:uncharacterized protein LOC143846757 n=1 Tax=Tasmannia lanceolata TaxID=3420 RepID=UPI00406493FF